MNRSLSYVLAIAVVVALAGCERNTEEATGGADEETHLASDQAQEENEEVVAFPRNEWECSDENAARITAWFEAHQSNHFAPIPVHQNEGLVQIEESHSAPSISDSYPVYIGIAGDSISVNDRRFDDVNGIGSFLSELAERQDAEARILGEEPRPVHLALAIHEDIRGHHIEEALRILTDIDEARFSLVFEAPRAELEVEGIPKYLVERLSELHPLTQPENRQEMLARMDEPSQEIAEIIEKCPEVVQVFEALETRPPDQRRPFIAEELPRAWLECDCDMDIEYLAAIKSWNPVLYREGQRPVIFVETRGIDILELVAEESDQLWKELAPRLL